MTALALTKRQQELLKFLERYAIEHDGLCPSYREMIEGLGLRSISGVHRLVDALQQRGHINRRPGHSRTIVMANAPSIAIPPHLMSVLQASAEEAGQDVGEFVVAHLREAFLSRAQDHGQDKGARV